VNAHIAFVKSAARPTSPPVPRELIVLGDDGTPDLERPYDGNEELFAEFDQ
jgi:hypothetical protein